MKNVKKVLALMLAVTMMFGVVSICASAIDTTSASFKITYKDANATVIDSAKAGDTIDVFIAIKTDGYTNNMNIQSFYDCKLLTQVSPSGEALSKTNAYEPQGRFANKGDAENVSQEILDQEMDLDAGCTGHVLDWGAAKFSPSLHNKRMYPNTWTAAEKEQYKGFSIAFQTTAANGSIITVNTENQFIDFIKLSFTVNEDTALNDSTFKLDFGASFIAIYPEDVALNIAQTGSAIKVSGTGLNVEYASAGGSTEPTAVLTNVQEPKVQWKADADGVLRLRFEGKLTGIVPTVGSDEKVTNIAKIGFKYSRDDATLANGTLVETKTLYDFTASEAGTYKFCAIVEVPMTADIISGATASDIHATAFITIGDNTSFASDPISTTIANEYTEGVTGGLTPFAA